MTFHTQSTAKASQRADVRQIIMASLPQKHSISDVRPPLRKHLAIGQTLMKHQPLKLQTKNGLNRRSAFVAEVGLDRFSQRRKVHTSIRPANPLIIWNQLIDRIRSSYENNGV